MANPGRSRDRRILFERNPREMKERDRVSGEVRERGGRVSNRRGDYKDTGELIVNEKERQNRVAGRRSLGRPINPFIFNLCLDFKESKAQRR